jgi:PAS domain S-box-containing protein
MFQRLFELSTDAMTVQDPLTGAFEDVNDATVRITGAPSKAALLGSNPARISPERQPDGTRSTEKARQMIQLAVERGSHRFEWVLTRFDGTQLPIEVVLTLIRGGTRPLLLSVSRDLTERQQAEAEIKQLNNSLEQRIAARTAELTASEARARALLEHAPEAIVVFDGETGRFLSGNAHACRLYGRAASELPHLTPADVSPEFQPNGRRSEAVAREKMAEALRGGAPAFEWMHQQPDGTLVPTEVRLVRLPAEGQTLLCATILDNTERIRREQALRRRHEQMQRHRNVLLELAQADKSDLHHALLNICSRSAATLDVARASYWSLQDNDAALVCETLYRRDPSGADAASPGARLAADSCPAYFRALATRRPIVANAVRTHPATSELVDAYLAPRGITSLLDAPVWLRGQVVGVLCHEHVGPAREWSAEEIDFASALAAMVSLALEESNRVRSERQLRESEQKFRALFEASSQGVMLHDEHQYLEVNPAIVRILGYDSPEELIGLHPGITSPPVQPNGADTRTLAQKYIQECLAQGHVRFDWVARRKSGEDIPVEVFLTRVQWSGKEIIQAAVNDISARKRAEAELRESATRLRESEARFSAAFHSSPLTITIARMSDGIFVEANETFLRWSGCAREEIIGQSSRGLGLWLNAADRDHFWGALHERNTVRDFECQLRTRRGPVYTMLLSADIIAINDQPHVMIVGHDITARKQAEAELLRTLEREKELGRLKSNFVSMVSHEFRTPLGIIQSSAEILNDYLDQLAPAERAEQLASITGNTRRMGEMMEEILVLSRLDAGRMEFKPAPLDLGAFCHRIVEEVRAATNHRCAIELARANLPAEAHADERLLGHIFTNLLGNAVKYSAPGATVQFTIEPDGGNVVCTFRDRGIGIPEADQQWLFQAFQRGGNVGDRPGTGLGLVIVKRCVELHGGNISIHSTPGTGTEVTVRLPLFPTQS